MAGEKSLAGLLNMATYTTITICNHALVLCGASPITALTDDSANARSLNAIYEDARKGFLTECRWSFSTTRSTLVTNSTTDLFPWTYDEESSVYNRPGTSGSCLRIWDMSTINAIWREEGEYLISDTAGLGARWTWDNSEVGLWRPKAITAFIDKLCSDICYMILNDVKKAEVFLEKYEKISLTQAMAENSQTGAQQNVIDDAWLGAKYGQDGNPARSYS